MERIGSKLFRTIDSLHQLSHNRLKFDLKWLTSKSYLISFFSSVCSFFVLSLFVDKLSFNMMNDIHWNRRFLCMINKYLWNLIMLVKLINYLHCNSTSMENSNANNIFLKTMINRILIVNRKYKYYLA